ncbi:MAG: PQQ-binding-like beta-propeller repeat protein, partial [candidate division KSB1 bacterium]|nr:PQQ-binding-like beta-propeller repeat protein [candidate division KSB1 bacterium]
KELWNFSYKAPGSVMFPGSRSVPAIDGKYIYSCGHNGDLYCIDITTHKAVWHKNIWTDFGGTQLPIWAITQCPLVYEDLVIVLAQAPEAGAVAFDKLTGKLHWKTPYLGNESYASPSVVKIDGKDHIVVVISSTNPIGHRELPQTPGRVVGIEPKTGKVLWQYDKWRCHISVPSAVDVGDNKVLVVGGYELGATMLKIEKQADGSYAAKELFTIEEFGDQTKPPILYKGYFYAQYGTNTRRDGLTCMSMDGKIMWKTMRNPDFNKGSMILADGLIIATDGKKSLYLIEPDPTGFKPIASAELLTVDEAGNDPMMRRFADQNWAPIALAEGKLLIRDQHRMLCVKIAE